jgi:hypothetical protein
VLVATGLPRDHPTRAALERVETGAMAVELALSTINERRLGDAAAPLERSGLFKAAKWLVRAGMGLRVARRGSHATSLAYLAAGLCFRFAWVKAGPPSARDDEAVARMAREP